MDIVVAVYEGGAEESQFSRIVIRSHPVSRRGESYLCVYTEQLRKIEHLSSELCACNQRNDALESDLQAARLSFDAKATKLEETERALEIKTRENSLLSRKNEALQHRIEEFTVCIYDRIFEKFCLFTWKYS